MSVEEDPDQGPKKGKNLENTPDRGACNIYEEAIAIIGMLSAAKNISLLDLSDEFCVDSLEKCENILRNRFNIDEKLVSTRNYDERLREIIHLVRMISYVSLELSEKFNDAHCSEITDQCVQHLMISYGLSPNDLYPTGRMYANVH